MYATVHLSGWILNIFSLLHISGNLILLLNMVISFIVSFYL